MSRHIQSVVFDGGSEADSTSRYTCNIYNKGLLTWDCTGQYTHLNPHTEFFKYCVINNNRLSSILVQRTVLNTKLVCVSVAQYNTTSYNLLNSVNILVLHNN